MASKTAVQGGRAEQNKQARQQAGFTLIEVLMAMAVFAFGLLALATMQITAVGGNSRAQNLTNAAILATTQLEALMSMAYDDPALNDTTGDGTGGLADDTAATADANTTVGDFTVLWNVAVDFPAADTKTVAVIVTGRGRRVTMRGVVPEITR